MNEKEDRTDPLFLAQRAHGNAVEYMPLAMILCLTAELAGNVCSLFVSCSLCSPRPISALHSIACAAQAHRQRFCMC
jgi:uncharacterized membrane protein YecN with MAPEG domain